MHEELERTAESPALSSVRPHGTRMELLDAATAIVRAEEAVESQVLAPAPGDPGGDTVLASARAAAERGERVAVVLPVASMAGSRPSMRRIAQGRLPVVAHALASSGGEDLAALTDLGWGVLCASSPEDSFDLALVARRAAEDAGVPFVVVHPHADGPSGGAGARLVAMVALPPEKACRTFVGPSSRVLPRSDPAHPSLVPLGDRAFGERVPFALASALREYGAVSGRRHDVFDRVPLADAPLVLVGMGAVGEALFAATGELRARGHEVSAIHLSALRPFPGAKLVKALSRALAVTILEPSDEPLTQGGVLARELKSAFTDALTWAPGFPGIGRVPKLFVGVTGPSFDVADLASVCDNMLADERGRRSFSFVDTEHALPRVAPPHASPEGGQPVALRWVMDDMATAESALGLTAAVLANGLGLRAHAILTPHAGGVTVDLVASRDAARGSVVRRTPRVVVATERGVASSEAVAALVPGAVLGVLAASGDAGLPDAARSIVRERRVRALALPSGADDASGLAVAAACAGVALAVGSRAPRQRLDAALVTRVVVEHLTAQAVAEPQRLAERAQRAFEGTLEALVTTDREVAALAASEVPPPRDTDRAGALPVS